MSLFKKRSSTEFNSTEVVKIVAHQLRSPLAALRFSNQALLETSDDERQLALLAESKKRIEHINKIVDTLLLPALSEDLPVALHPEQTNIAELIDDIVSEYSPIAELKGVLLTVNIHTEKCTKNLDKELIREAISNIIDNAIKYSRDGGGVDIEVVADNEAINIAVSDQGIGVPEDEQNSLFEKFKRSQNAMEFDTSGLGVGLYLSKKYIEAHGGNLVHESNEPQGSIFTVTLP